MHGEHCGGQHCSVASVKESCPLWEHGGDHICTCCRMLFPVQQKVLLEAASAAAEAMTAAKGSRQLCPAHDPRCSLSPETALISMDTLHFQGIPSTCPARSDGSTRDTPASLCH